MAALAAALDTSPYEAGRHLAAGGARVLSTFAERAQADRAAAALAAAGFAPFVLDPAAARDERVVVRGFELAGRALAVSDREGTRLAVPYAAITALVRGVRMREGDEREPLVEVHAPSAPVLEFGEHRLQYDGLHLERQATAAANFARLVARLREQAPQAGYDDRLNTRAAQLAVLGDRLAPETHLEVATLLVAQTLQSVRSAA